MNYKFLTLKDYAEWNAYLQNLPLDQQDVYYTPEYYKIYEDNGDGTALCFVFEKNGQLAIYPFLINSVNKIGYKLDKEYYDIQGAYGYNGVVSSSYEKDFIDAFYKTFNTYCIENNIIAEFIRFHPLINNILFSKNHLQVLFDRRTVYIDLTKSYENIFSDFQRSTKKKIKRIKNRNQVYCKIFENNHHMIDEFYSIYKKTMDRVSSSDYLYFNKEYFYGLHNLKNSVLIIAYLKNTPIAGRIAFFSDLYIHGHLGGTISEYLSISPFNLVNEATIEFGKKIGCSFLHFGGGSTPATDDPVFKYKSNFSKTSTAFYIGKKVHNWPVYNEIVRLWGLNNPEKLKTHNSVLLKYRF